MKWPAALVASLALLAMATSASAQNRWWGGAMRGPPPRAGRFSPAPPFARGPPPRGMLAPPPLGMRSPNSLGAGWREQQYEARFGVRRGAMAPLGRVIEGIGRRTPGRQLDAGIEFEGGRTVYRVRWITTHGRRIDYIVDAATGNILRGR
ncbi:MAG TPA: PepSY domain-containing protein [Caulobacteraceae bacterium]